MKQRRAPLGELCSLIKGTSPISKTPPGRYPLITTGEENKTANTFQLDAEAVCIPLISSTGHGHASLKRVHHQTGKFALANLLAAAVVKDRSVLSARFLARYLMSTKDRLIVPLMTGAANMSISIDRLATIPVEFPSLAEQNRIVRMLDEGDDLRKLRAEADRRTANLIPALFHEIFGDLASNPKRWPLKTLGEVTRIDAPMVDPRLQEYLDLPHIGPERIEAQSGRLLPSKTAREDALVSGKFLFDRKHVLYSKIRPYLRKVALPEFRGLSSADVYPLRPVSYTHLTLPTICSV